MAPPLDLTIAPLLELGGSALGAGLVPPVTFAEPVLVRIGLDPRVTFADPNLPLPLCVTLALLALDLVALVLEDVGRLEAERRLRCRADVTLAIIN